MKNNIAPISSIKTKGIAGNSMTGNSFLMYFDNAGQLSEKNAPFDIFAQIIDGLGEIIINGKSYFLKSGESMIIPALKSHIIKAKGRLKMMVTVIKGH